MRGRAGWEVWVLSGLLAVWVAGPVVGEDGFGELVQPVLREYCVSCHGADAQKGKLRLDTLTDRFEDPAVAAVWKEVVNAIGGHEMPPEDEPQPSAEAAGRMAGWLEEKLAAAEVARRSGRVVLRRLNRSEYNRTIRDLLGVDFRPADKFPEDPPAGGFDNIGAALTMSPMQVELYYGAAREILDRAMPGGERPKVMRWRFDPEENREGGDRLRVERDGQRILLNDGENRTEKGFTVVHHESWDRHVGFRDFTVPRAGEYVIRVRAAGRVPGRKAVVASAAKILAKRRDEETAKDPAGRKRHEEQYERDLAHFREHRSYGYGPPRMKLVQHLGGTPLVIAEMDVDAPEGEPREYEVRAWFTPVNAGVELVYAYAIPKLLENFWMQGRDEFARPELLIDWIEIKGPVVGSWPPETAGRVLGGAPREGKDEGEEAKEVLRRFMARAYRRPVGEAEVERMAGMFAACRPEKGSFVEAIKVPLTAVLTSPHFLYLVEPAGEDGGLRRLNGYELAARLSYFLWSSMPDEELTRLAGEGKLGEAEELRKQLGRMLGDERSGALVENFAGQWLGLRKVGANPPSETLYPEYDRHLEVSMVREAEGFFAEVLRGGHDVRRFIRSEFVTINERLARHYGIDGVKGDTIRRVEVPEGVRRGGLVTQAAVHCITSNGTRTSPVVRGVWVMRTLLGSDPGLPVANVGEIQPKVPGIDKATVRQRLAVHREAASCARCHDRIDPLGLALENFNAAGEWRDREGHGYNGRIERDDPVIDVTAKMPDGTEFAGVEGLQEQLLRRDGQFMEALATQLTTYALGRETGFADRAAIRGFVETMRREGSTLKSLITAIVTSDAFMTR